MSAQIAADLRAAAEVLRRDGWTQKTVGSLRGCKCALGALHYVASNGQGIGEDELSDDERNRANEAAAVVYPLVGQWVAAFNDTPGRTADEVIAADAADAAEADQ